MVAILDQRGEPIKSVELTEPQTARLGTLHQEFALHPTRGLTPGKLATILEQAEQGDLIAQCDLFEDMEEKDAHIYAEMSKRKRALQTLEWDVVAPRNASKQEENAAALAKELLQDLELEDVVFDMADAIGYAFSCLELEWHRVEGQWMPATIEHRPQRWFTLDQATRTQLRLRDNSAEGAQLRPFGWIQHQHKAKSGYLGRAGLHRVLAWPFLFKNYSLRDLAEFLEIYGLPLRLGTYPPGASDKEKATLLRAVVNIGHAAAGIVPEGMKIDFKEAAKGASDPFEAMLAWCESSQSKAILGGTLTTSAQNTGLGSNLGDVHNEVRHDLMIADARQIASTITRDLIYPVLALNTTGIDSLRRCPRFVFDTREPEDLKLYSEAIPKLVSVGTRIPAKWVRDKLRIPEPEDDEEVLAPAAPALPAALRGRLPGASAALRADVPDYPDAQVERLEGAAQPALEGMIEQIRAIVEEAGSLEELRDRLADAFDELDSGQFALVMTEALAAAELGGRYELLQGL